MRESTTNAFLSKMRKLRDVRQKKILFSENESTLVKSNKVHAWVINQSRFFGLFYVRTLTKTSWVIQRLVYWALEVATRPRSRFRRHHGHRGMTVHMTYLMASWRLLRLSGGLGICSDVTGRIGGTFQFFHHVSPPVFRCSHIFTCTSADCITSENSEGKAASP